MNTTLPLLAQIRIASPCTADWNAMAGDERVRFCGSCEKNVYNLSSMTGTEVVELVRATEGKMCARFYRRHDGTVLTSDCPVGVHHRVAKRRRRMAGVTAAFASLFVSGCISNATPDEGKPDIIGEILRPQQPPQPRHLEGIAGGICPVDMKDQPVVRPEQAIAPEPASPN